MHTDRIGASVAAGDVVAVVRSGNLAIGEIVRCTPKMVVIRALANTGRWRVKSEFHAYPNDLVKVDQHQATCYLLSKGKV